MALTHTSDRSGPAATVDVSSVVAGGGFTKQHLPEERRDVGILGVKTVRCGYFGCQNDEM